MNTLGHLTQHREFKLKSDHFIHCFFHWGPGKGLRSQAASPLAYLFLPLFLPHLHLSASRCSCFFVFFFSFQIIVLFYVALIPGFSWIVMISVERLSQQKHHPHLYTYKYVSFLLLSCSNRVLWSYLA